MNTRLGIASMVWCLATIVLGSLAFISQSLLAFVVVMLIFGIGISVLGSIKPYLPIIITLVLFPLGQIAKVPNLFGHNVPLLANDLLVGWVMVSNILYAVRHRAFGDMFSANRHFVPFYVWIIISFLLADLRMHYSATSITHGLSYAGRFVSYTLLISPISYWSRVVLLRRRLIFSMAIGVTLLCLIGFAQLIFLPNMYDIVRIVPMINANGYDPHMGRLVSTFLDPNLLGATLLLPIAIGFSYMSLRHGNWTKLDTLFTTGVCVLLTAQLMTVSRAAFASASLAMFLCIIYTIARRKLIGAHQLVAGIQFVLFVVVGMVTRLGGRILNTLSGTNSIPIKVERSPLPANPVAASSTHSQILSQVPSATVHVESSAYARYVGWHEAVHMFTTSPVYGYGYDFISNARLALHSLSSVPTVSAANFDSSILDVLCMTGFVGLLLYLWAFGKTLWVARTPYPYLIVGTLSGTFCLVLDSFTTDSLFYPFTLELLCLVLGVSMAVRYIASSGESNTKVSELRMDRRRVND